MLVPKPPLPDPILLECTREYDLIVSDRNSRYYEYEKITLAYSILGLTIGLLVLVKVCRSPKFSISFLIIGLQMGGSFCELALFFIRYHSRINN